MKKRNRAFTLIELIAVLVIMAIIALIVTPLVMSIIKKARISADKRSIDAYGRSVELAIANYLLDNGDFPTDISQLTIEYSGNQVVCETTQINTDSSVYLAGCTVGGRNVENYTYGSDKSPTYTAYTVGDQVTYNNENYYVIKDSGTDEASVTLLKAEPLSYSEIQTYSNGTGAELYDYGEENGHIGGMQYHSSSSTYSTSYVKTTVDAWKNAKAPAATEARLITYNELLDNLGYENSVACTDGCYYTGSLDNVPNFVYNSNYWYWTMSPNNGSSPSVWRVDESGSLGGNSVSGCNYYSCDDGAVRPVIVLSKSNISNAGN